MADDLRAWLSKVEAMGELKQVDGADWNIEMGTISVLHSQSEPCSALLFDNIKGYPSGHRVVTCCVTNLKRLALTLYLPETRTGLEMVGTMREKLEQWEGSAHEFPYQVVHSGPILENVRSGKDVNLLELPVPKWHEEDGGRYLGTGDAIITQDPETGEVNLGTYRVMVHDERTAGLFMSPGKHGRIHCEKYHAAGKPCPVAMSFGHHPLFNRMAAMELPPGSEYNFIGAVQGEPVKVIREEITGLPIPADSEIVVVGWCPPGKKRIEGPFGEWTGYYASRGSPAPIVEVERIYFRNKPIILGSPPMRPPSDGSLFRLVKGSAMLWNALVKSNVPDVRGVWMSEIGLEQFVVVSIKQRYPGHVKQAGLLACQNRPAAFHGRYVVVVDDDIDPSNIEDVMWALATRTDPEKDIDIVRRAWSTPLDTMIRKPTNAYFNSRGIIDACKPWEWIDEFPRDIRVSDEWVSKVKDKWGAVLNLNGGRRIW
jgi:UbiD family decarboxylase